MNVSRQVLLRRLLLAVFLGVPIGFVWLGGGDWLSLENFQSHKDQLLAFAQNHFGPTFLLWDLGYAVAVAFSLPGAALLSLITGFLFGRWLGMVLIVAAAFAPVSLSAYAWTTMVGIVPASFVFANLGRSLGEVRSLEGLLSPQVLVALGLLGVLALLPVLQRTIARFRSMTKRGQGT
jgi:uncharacterized membrane protein YdjX (TVP38/TMEM64 family)